MFQGAECSKVPKMMKALQAGRPVPVTVVPNLADGLNTSSVGTNAFATIKNRLDRMVMLVSHSVMTVDRGVQITCNSQFSPIMIILHNRWCGFKLVIHDTSPLVIEKGRIEVCLIEWARTLLSTVQGMK